MRNEALHEDFEYLYSRQLPWDMLNKKSVLVTGGTGLIGSILLKYMDFLNREKGYQIQLVTIVRDRKRAEAVLDGLCVQIETADITMPVQLEGGIDFIFHCAAITKSKEMVAHPVRVFESIVTGTNHVLKLAVQKQIQSMVYLSSMEVYGQPDNTREWVSEEMSGYIDTLKCRSCYPLGKRMAENLCFDYSQEYQVPVKIARLAQSFGAGVLPGDNRVFAQFVRSVLHRDNIVLHTDGSSRGNYCYTADAAFGLFTLLLKGENGEAYNVANEKAGMTIREMAELVADKIAEGQIKVIYDIPKENKYGYAPPVKMKLCSDKIRSLGWEANFGMEEMYQRMIKSQLCDKQEYEA